MKTLLQKLLVVSLVSVLGACGGSRGGSGGEKPMLAAGSEAPALVRVDHRGKVVALRGEPSIVYFYPKDGTPGCTKEACAFRDSWSKYEAAGIRVIGVSTDTEAEHRKFAEEHQLQFSLIADPEHAWSDAFGVGRHFLARDRDARVSFLIDPAGKVVKVYPDVDPGVHADQVLADAKGLGLSK
jgi:peroxiredoxin Q/BCP